MKKLFLIVAIASMAACNYTDTNNGQITVNNGIPAPAPVTFKVVATYPHDTTFYTEGLQLYNNELFESTGNYGVSKLIKTDLATGKPTKEILLDTLYFGEGLTVLNDTIYQMTYRENTCFVYDANFKLIRTMKYDTEGWGMTTDGRQLIASDGTSNLYYRDPATFANKKIVGVSDNNGPVANINELEYIDGFIYANVWNTNYILKIDPSNGHVVGRMDFTGLLEKSGYPGATYEKGNVLNGIAYDPAKKTLLITGKLWPLIYEVKL